MVPLFIRITVVVALALVALWILGFVIHLLFLAAIIAAVIVGVMAVAGMIRRRRLRGRSAVMNYRR